LLAYDEEYFCNDTVTSTDLLGFEPYVDAITEFLTAEYTKPPITFSIEGKWGSGKSSFMKQLKKRIDTKNEEKRKKFLNFHFRRKKYFTIWFNAWRYDKEKELWSAFALSVIEKISNELSLWQKIWARFKLTILRLKFKFYGKSSFRINIFILCLLLLFTFFISIPKFHDLLINYSTDGLFKNMIMILIGFTVPIIPAFNIYKDLSDVIGNTFDFSKYLSSPNYEEHISFIEQFHSDFNKIIESYAGKSKVYVFIDDLDRCEIPKAAELMQAINLMISEEAKIYFCIGMDREIISAGLVAKNENVCKYLFENSSRNKLEYGYNFVEKFIQIPFKIPSPNDKDIESLFIYKPNIEYSHAHPSYIFWKLKRLFLYIDYKFLNKLYTDNRQQEGISQNNVNINISNDNLDIEDDVSVNDLDCDERVRSLEISDNFKDIKEMVTPALDNNPRRIKQFLNLFRFYRTLGLNIGLFTYKKETAPNQKWNCHKLAKYVTICIKWPDIIASLNSNKILLEEIQLYAIKPDTFSEKIGKWAEDEQLIELMKYGFVNNTPQKSDEYTLIGLDYSKLLNVSPVIMYPVSVQNIGVQDTLISNVISCNYKFSNWSINKYPLIKIFGVNFVPLFSNYDSLWQSRVNKLVKLVLDDDNIYTLKKAEKLDLKNGYTLEAKEIDVEGKKVWLQFEQNGQYVNDAIISTEVGTKTWTCELNAIQGVNNVTVLRVHVFNIFQGAESGSVQIDGLWLIDFSVITNLNLGERFGEYTLIKIINGVNSFDLGKLVFKKEEQRDVTTTVL
jgi:S-layer protein (TIGR01567 family)